MKTLMVLIMLVFCATSVFAFETYGNEKVFVKNGVTYIIGNPTPEQRAESDKAVKDRFDRNEQRIQKELDRAERLEIERIRATKVL